MNLTIDELETPVGRVRWVARGERLCALGFVDRWPGLQASLERRFGELVFDRGGPPRIRSKLIAYFDGEVTALDDVEIDMAGTPFQEKVWKALRSIQTGTTTSYASLALATGHPSAVRAVGAANGANPISIVVPCHRVIRANGDLCGYGGGIERKRWLLAHEARATGRTLV